MKLYAYLHAPFVSPRLTLGISLLCMWSIFCSRPWVTVSSYAVGQDSSYWNSYLEWPRAELTPWFTWHLVWYGISKGKHTPSARSHTLSLYLPLLHRVLINWLSDSTWHSLRGENSCITHCFTSGVRSTVPTAHLYYIPGGTISTAPGGITWLEDHNLSVKRVFFLFLCTTDTGSGARLSEWSRVWLDPLDLNNTAQWKTKDLKA